MTLAICDNIVDIKLIINIENGSTMSTVDGKPSGNKITSKRIEKPSIFMNSKKIFLLIF